MIETREKSALDREAMSTYEEDSINLLDLLVRFLAKWRTLLVSFALVMLIGIVMIYRIPPLYESNVSFVPTQTTQESTSLSALFGQRRSGDLYVGLIQSRAVRDNVIRRLDLHKVYQTDSQDMARNRLTQSTKIVVGADSIISVVVRDASSAMATRIANSYLDALEDQQDAMASSQSGQRRSFYAKQLQLEKDALTAAEEDLRKTQESLGIVQVEQQTQLGISAIAEIRAQITNAQVRLASLLLSATEQNPEVQALRSQIAQLQTGEHRLEAGASGKSPGAAMPTGRMPAANLEYVRKQREVEYHNTLFRSLAHELESARISEAEGGGTFQVVDRAVEPEFRAWPPRKMLLLVTFGASLLISFFVVLGHLLVERILGDPANQTQIAALRKQLQLRG